MRKEQSASNWKMIYHDRVRLRLMKWEIFQTAAITWNFPVGTYCFCPEQFLIDDFNNTAQPFTYEIAGWAWLKIFKYLLMILSLHFDWKLGANLLMDGRIRPVYQIRGNIIRLCQSEQIANWISYWTSGFLIFWWMLMSKSTACCPHFF